MKDTNSDQINETVTDERPDQKHPAQQQPVDTAREQIFSGIANRDTFDPPKMTPATAQAIYSESRLTPLKATAPQGL